jgi:hypothetical protein
LCLQIGEKLADKYRKHLDVFVRCYVFNLADPYVERMPKATL